MNQLPNSTLLKVAFADSVVNYFSGENPDVGITYGYVPGKGRGHLSQAEIYKKILEEEGINPRTMTNSSGGAGFSDKIRNFFNANSNDVLIDTGWGNLPVVSKGIHVPTDYRAGATKADILPIVDPKAYSDYTPGGLKDFLRENHGIDDLPFNKIVTLSGGDSAVGLKSKIELLKKTLGDDYGFLVFGGKDLDGYGDRVRSMPFMDRDAFQDIVSRADLNVNHAGSSSVTEALRYRNPNIIMNLLGGTEGLAKNNMEFAKQFGIPFASATKDPNAEGVIKSLISEFNADEAKSRSDEAINLIKQKRKDFAKRIKTNAALGRLKRLGLGGALLAGLGYGGYEGYKAINE